MVNNLGSAGHMFLSEPLNSAVNSTKATTNKQGYIQNKKGFIDVEFHIIFTCHEIALYLWVFMTIWKY